MAPIRTCVGCRRAVPQSELLRFVARAGEVVADPTRTLPGRGAWCHDTPSCRELAVRRHTFGRALRLPR